MKFHPASLKDLTIIEIEPRVDDRGFFARVFCTEECRNAGIEPHITQMNNSLNTKAGTFRGLRFQLPPAAESKIIRCLAGALYDIAVDLRPSSPNFKKWFGIELTAENRMMLAIPRGFAHGYLTLRDNTEVLYIVGAPYTPHLERGLRVDDPAINISLPRGIAEIAPRDRQWPDLDHQMTELELFRGWGQ